jgi:hypothetical protein
MQMGVTFEKQIFGIFLLAPGGVKSIFKIGPKNILIQGKFLKENIWHHLFSHRTPLGGVKSPFCISTLRTDCNLKILENTT